MSTIILLLYTCKRKRWWQIFLIVKDDGEIEAEVCGSGQDVRHAVIITSAW